MAQNSNLAVDNRLGIHRVLRKSIASDNAASFDLDATGTAIQLTGAASTPGALANITPGLFTVEYGGYVSLIYISTTAVTELVSSVRKPSSTSANTYTATNGTGTITVGTSQAADSKPNIWVASSILYIGMGTSGSAATTVRLNRVT